MTYRSPAEAAAAALATALREQFPSEDDRGGGGAEDVAPRALAALLSPWPREISFVMYVRLVRAAAFEDASDGAEDDESGGGGVEPSSASAAAPLLQLLRHLWTPLRVTTAAHALALLEPAPTPSLSFWLRAAMIVAAAVGRRVSPSCGSGHARATAAPDRAMEVRMPGQAARRRAAGSAGGSTDGSFEDAAR